ncbi:lysophospholipid acyltransferase family protein [Kocuria turfanensis]|uniref:lysophospholipid acyltransferase family protein n=1 Tax=Kocuria turfanensis TaxID=388357 RepID=UPI004036994C
MNRRKHHDQVPVRRSIDGGGETSASSEPAPSVPPASSAQLDPARFRDPRRRLARRIAQRVFLHGLAYRTVRRTVVTHPAAEALDGPCIVVANHSSHLDAPLVLGSVPRRVRRNLATGVAADYFFTAPHKRMFTELIFNAFPVDRTGTGANRGLSKQLLKAGVPLLVFPEGTRSRTGRMAPFKIGAAGLAKAVGVPVLPVALIGAHEAMPHGSKWPRPGRPRVVVAVGEPLVARDKEPTAAFNERIESSVRALYAEHRPRIDA